MISSMTLEACRASDLFLLEGLMGDARTTEHLGGPESPEQLHRRQDRYQHLEGGDRMLKILELSSGAGVGSVGFWTKGVEQRAGL